MENRSADRKATIYHSELLSPRSGEVIGNMVDVSAVGIRMVSPNAITPGTDIELLVKLPSLVGGKNEHQFVASVRWCRPDVNTDYFAVGVMINDDDIETQNILTHIHQLFCFSE